MIWIGTSGYNYPEWKGSFYPADLPAAKMLPYYAARFPDGRDQLHVLPDAEREAGRRLGGADAVALQADAEGAAADHPRQPAERTAATLVSGFCSVAGTLGDKLGALLFQLPPNLKKDLPLFDAFLDELPPKVPGRVRVPARVVARRRGVRAAARRRGLALCVADSEKLSTPVRVTADYAYFRLRDEGYTRRRHRALGRHDRAARPPRAATCSSTSSTRKKARDPSSRRCCASVWGCSLQRSAASTDDPEPSTASPRIDRDRRRCRRRRAARHIDVDAWRATKSTI